jgi:hypothetical protein
MRQLFAQLTRSFYFQAKRYHSSKPLANPPRLAPVKKAKSTAACDANEHSPQRGQPRASIRFIRHALGNHGPRRIRPPSQIDGQGQAGHSQVRSSLPHA